jgi:hypothetical protein
MKKEKIVSLIKLINFTCSNDTMPYQTLWKESVGERLIIVKNVSEQVGSWTHSFFMESKE